MSNTHILSDLSAILNPEHIRPGVNLKNISERMISGGIIQPQRDPQEKMDDELRKLSQEYGINLDMLTPSRRDQKPSVMSPRPSFDNRAYNGMNMKSDVDTRADPRSGSRSDQYTDSRSDQYTESMDTNNDYMNNYQADNGRSEPEPPRFQFDDTSALRERTYEQERREHINKVNAEMGAMNAISFENEKREDIKDQMLEEIDSLRYTLREEEIDLSRVPEVNRGSTFDEVDSVLRILRHKNDRIRYCSFAEEFFLIGAYGLEELFDGKRLWLGKYKPDLTGWHNHVNVKLRRMRHDTSTLVSGVMHDFNIGPGMRLLLELVPNFLMYSKMKKQQHGAPSLYNDETVALNERLREVDNI